MQVVTPSIKVQPGNVLVRGTVFVTWQVLTAKCVSKKRRRDNKENCQILRSSSEFTKCKGILCAVSFALLSLVLGDPAQDKIASLPSCTGTLGCGGFAGCAPTCCKEVGDLKVAEPKLSSHETSAGLVLPWAGCWQVTGAWQLFVPALPWHAPVPELCYLSKLLAGKIDVCKALSLRPSWNSCQRCNPT